MNIVKWHGLDIDPMKINESITTKAEISRIETSFNESTNESGITVLYPKIEAIHEGRTRNFNRYLGEKLKGNPDLKSGVYSWTAPYPKPVIYNHDINTEATGRVYSAVYSEYTAAGRPGIIVTPKITSEKAISDIQKGLLLTVSIGASTNAAVCSVCGTDIINEGFCGHMRGEEVDGQVVEWIAGDLWFDELSWVNVPADSDAMIVHSNVSPGAIAPSENTTSNTVLTTETIVVKTDSVTHATEKEDEIVEENKIVIDATEETTETVEETVVVTETEETTETEEVITTETAVTETTETTETVEDETTETVVTEEAETEEVVADETKEELAQAQTDLAEAQNTIEELTAANEALAKELSETVAGFLVDLRIAVGKESSKEEGLAKFATRSIESLKDSISDILSEGNVKTTRTVEKVEMPKGENVITESKTLSNDKQVVISNEEVLLSLLTGRR